MIFSVDDLIDVFKSKFLGRKMNNSLGKIQNSIVEQELQNLAIKTAYVFGLEFFKELATSLADILKVSTVLIAKCEDSPVTRVETIVLYHRRQWLQNINYSIQGTPCNVVFETGSAYFPDCVQQQFPEDVDLRKLQVDSYGGLELVDANKNVVGHICVMNCGKLRPEVWSLPAIRLIRARCGAEIERIRLYEERDAIRKNYESILDCAVDGMFLKNAEREFVYQNRACKLMFKRASQIEDRCRPDDGRPLHRCLKELDEQVINQRSSRSSEVELVNSDGSPSCYQITESPVWDERADCAGIVGVIRDVTKFNESREILTETQRLASLGTIAAGIAHDINNPLAAIHLLAETALSDRELSVATRGYLETILESVQSASQIVDEVLRTSTNQSTKRTYYLAGDIVFKAMDQIRRESEQAGIDLRIMDVEDVFVEVNSIEIQQVLINLLSNAINASTNCRKKEVRIRVRRVHDRCVISIRDFGIGISKEDAKHIFDPFYTTRLVEGGSGLGLSISHRIMQNHQGRLLFEDVEPGTRFVVELPAKGEVDANHNS